MDVALLSESASQQLVDSLADLVEKELEKRMCQKEKRYLMQKEVIEKYQCDHKILRTWESAGLKKFKLGKRWMYDTRDIENVIETLKV